MCDYEKRLLIPINGYENFDLYTPDNLLIATGYVRIVIGGRGPYVEFNECHIKQDSLYVPVEQRWRINSKIVYYIEYRSRCASNVKVYFQKKLVDYADYMLNMFYISPFELQYNNNYIIQSSQKNVKLEYLDNIL